MLVEGMCLYQGPIPGLIPFLSSNGYVCPSYHNPADYVMEIACGDHGEAYFKLVTAMEIRRSMLMGQSSPFAASPSDKVSQGTDPIENDVTLPKSTFKFIFDIPKDSEEKLTVAEPTLSPDIFSKLQRENKYPTSAWQQFWIILKRTLLSMLRDQTLTHMRIVSHVVVGALIGMLYFGVGDDGGKVQSNMGFIFFTVLITMFTAMMPTLLTCKNTNLLCLMESLTLQLTSSSY